MSGISSFISYFLVIWLGVIFSSIQPAVNFGDQDISKSLNNLLAVGERTNTIKTPDCVLCSQVKPVRANDRQLHYQEFIIYNMNS